MTRHYFIVAAAALLLAAGETVATAAPTPAPAPPPTTLNCLLASNVFAQREPDQQRKDLAHQALLFYLGRLDPRTSEPQLKNELKQTAQALKGVNAASLMNACLVDLRSKASMLQTAGQQLQQGK